MEKGDLQGGRRVRVKLGPDSLCNEFRFAMHV